MKKFNCNNIEITNNSYINKYTNCNDVNFK